MNHLKGNTGPTGPYPEVREIKKLFRLLGKLCPEVQEKEQRETTLLRQLQEADFYTRRQTLMIWEIYRIVLGYLSETAIRATVHYVDTHDEEEVMDYWASGMDRTLSELYRLFTMSSIESFLQRTRRGLWRSDYGSE